MALALNSRRGGRRGGSSVATAAVLLAALSAALHQGAAVAAAPPPFGHYTVASSQSTAAGWRAALAWNDVDGATDPSLPITASPPAPGAPAGPSTYSPEPALDVEVRLETDTRLRVRITVPGAQRWEVPDVVQTPQPTAPAAAPLYSARLGTDDGDGDTAAPFSLSVTRTPDAAGSSSAPTVAAPVLELGGLYFSDQFIAFDTPADPQPLLSGLGEHKLHSFWLPTARGEQGFPEPDDGGPDGRRTRTRGLQGADGDGDDEPASYVMFASDSGTPYAKALYGVHPFYLQGRRAPALPSRGEQAQGGGGGGGGGDGALQWHGVFLLNSNAQEVAVARAPDTLDANGGDPVAQGRISFRLTGGIVDLFVFLGPTPEAVVRQYHDVIGRPALVPRWSLGFHQSRYGYRSLAEVQGVVEGFAAHDIPLETVWLDIDYMRDWRVWTLDEDNFPAAEVTAFVEELHAGGQHLVPIVDPGVKIVEAGSGYAPYDDGIAADVFVRKGPTAVDDGRDTPLVVGKVWPRLTHFVDWFHPAAAGYWEASMRAFYDGTGGADGTGSGGVRFDGLWIDMNEIASFCDGRCPLDSRDDTLDNLFTCVCDADNAEVSALNDPPYLPGGREERPCRTAVGTGLDCGTISMSALHYGGIREYDSHSLHGAMESATTAAALRAVTGKRAFVLTRSSFAGTGRHAAHWLGDNDSTWDDMLASIPAMLRMGMYGIPMVGADICGFNGEADAELCTRWLQLGCWYPFARDHNVIGARAQAPYDFGEAVTARARAAIVRRQRYLPTLYTLMRQAAAVGGAAARPLAFEFPDDATARGIYRQFLWGGHLLVSPVLGAGNTTVRAYLPAGPDARWFDLETGALARGGADGWSTLAAPLESASIPVHLRAGAVVTAQEPQLTTAASAQQPYTLVAALDYQGPGVAAAYELASDTQRHHSVHHHSQGGAGRSQHRPGHSLSFGALYLDGGDTDPVGDAYALLHFTATRGDSTVVAAPDDGAVVTTSESVVFTSTLAHAPVAGTPLPLESLVGGAAPLHSLRLVGARCDRVTGVTSSPEGAVATLQAPVSGPGHDAAAVVDVDLRSVSPAAGLGSAVTVSVQCEWAAAAVAPDASLPADAEGMVIAGVVLVLAGIATAVVCLCGHKLGCPGTGGGHDGFHGLEDGVGSGGDFSSGGHGATAMRDLRQPMTMAGASRAADADADADAGVVSVELTARA